MQCSRKQWKRLPGALVAALALSCVVAANAPGAGTPAGTTIMNQTVADYRSADGTPKPPVLSNTITMVVNQTAAVNMTPVTAARVGHVNTMVDFPIAIVNSGNGHDNFLLTVRSAHDFPAVICLDANGDGVIDQHEIAAGTVSQTGTLPADSTCRIVVRVAIPANRSLNGFTDLLSLTASSTFDASVQATGSCATVVSSAALAMTLSVDNTMPRGGDRVTYTLTYNNGGNAAAATVQARDVLDHFLNYVTSSSSLPPATVSGRTLAWNLGTIAAGASGSLTFQADLASNAIPGSEIHNAVQLQYNDGPNADSGASVERNFITVQPGGAATVEVSPATAAAAGEPGDTVVYPLTVTNNGGLAESFTLSFSSTLGIPWLFFADAGGNGSVDPREPATTSTGAIPPNGGQCRLLAQAILPVVQTDGARDGTAFTVTSRTDAANYRSASAISTIRIPVMRLVKTADAPDPRSGSEITYRIAYSNSGGGHAFEFAIQDSIPARTTYVPESVTLDDIQKTDEADGDEVLVTGGAIIARVGTVPPRQSGVLAFRVRIN